MDPKQLLTRVKQYIFNPFLNTRPLIEDYLKNQNAGTAHSFRIASGPQLLLLWDGAKIVEIDMAKIPDAVFINTANIGALEGSVEGYMNRFPQLGPFKQYNVQVLTPGATFETPFSSGLVHVFVASTKKDQNYFDFVVYHSQGNGVVTYAIKQGGGFVHSGDVGALLHTVIYQNNNQNNNFTQTPFVLAVNGYHKRSIRFFADQLPVVFVINHETKTINMIPCPLDQATVGNSTLSGLVVGQRVGDRVRYCVLPAPLCVDSVDTGNLSPPTKQAVNQAIQQAQGIWEMPPVQQIPQVTAKPVETVEKVEVPVATGTETIDLFGMKVIQFVEQGVNSTFALPSSLIVGFGAGFQYGSSGDKPVPFNLPHVFGQCGQISGCALGHLPTGQPLVEHQIRQLLNSTYPIVHLSDNWLDSSQNGCQFMGNGLFIIHHRKVDQTKLVDPKVRDEYLTNICINGLIMAGPNSIVLIELVGKLYFFRGVSVPGLLDVVPFFGHDVSDIFTEEKLANWFISGRASTMQWPTVVQKGSDRVCWQSKEFKIGEIVDLIMGLPLDQISAHQAEIIDIMTQVSVLLNPEEITKVRNALDKSLLEKINSEITPLRQTWLTYVHEHSGDDDFSKKSKLMIAEIKTNERQLHASVQRLSNVLENLVSVRGASSQKQNIKRRERQAQIASNIDKAKNMTALQLGELLDKYCEKYGVLVASVDYDMFRDALTAVGQQKFLEWVNQHQGLLLASRHPRMPFLDALTMGCMLEQTSKDAHHPLSGSTSCVAIPQGSSGNALHSSAMPFLLLDRHVDMKNPDEIFWPSEANDERTAMFRIRMRSTISEATASRQFHISPSSKDLGLLMVHMILTTMENIVHGMQIPDPQKDWDNTTCQVMRGLFGQLLSLLASGQNVLSTAFQFVGKNPNLEVIPADQMWIVAKMIYCFPYTCWDQTNIKRNVYKYLVRCVRKLICDKVTEPIRKQIAKIDADSVKDSLEKRNEDLRWLAVAVEVIFELAHNDHLRGQSQEIAHRLLSLMSTELRERASDNPKCRGLRSVYRCVNLMVQGEADFNSEAFRNTLEIALNVMVQRSGVFGAIKAELRDQVHNSGWDGKYKEYRQILDNLSAKVPGAPVRVQNVQAIETQDEGRLASDAEIRRTPWSVTKDAVDWTNDVTFVLTGTRTGDHTGADETQVAVIQKPAVITELESLPASDKALTLAQSLPTVPWQELVSHGSINFGYYARMMQFVGVQTEDDVTNMTRQMVEAFLIGWRDPIAVEERFFAKWK